jgi:hypothetical protein
MEKKTWSDEELVELHKEALENWEITTEDDKDQRRLANDEAVFLAKEDGMWSEDARDKRRNRPMFTVDRISPVKDQLTGNQRQTRTGIKVFPKKDGTKDTADVYTGLIRSIEENSDANEAYDNAFDEGSEGGFGGWRILYNYNPDGFDREIVIDPVYSAATSMWFDPSDLNYTKKKAMWAFLVGYMTPKEYKKAYPDRPVSDFPQESYKSDWVTPDRVRISEYWFKVKYKRILCQMSDGTVIDKEDEKEVLDELAEEGISVVKEREADAYHVYMTVMNGMEIIEKPQLWAGSYIPLIPFYGKRRIIDGKKFTWGIVRKAMDAQRISNYAISTQVETTALTPKDPIMYTSEMIKNYSQDWKLFNTRNTPFLGFDADPKSAGSGGAPFRLGAPAVQTALIQQTQQSIEDVRAATGMDAAMGQNVPELRSGKAIIAQQNQGDRGHFIYQDNLEKSKKYTGEQLVDLISKVMDTEEMVQIIGPNENMEEVEINKTVVDRQTGKEVIVNDLSVGKYGVSVQSGPAAATKRQETTEQLLELTANDPEMKLLAGDVLIGNMDLNDGDELKKRFRKQQIDKGIVKPTDEERQELGLDKPRKPDPMKEALMRNVEQQTVTEEMKQAEMEAKIKKTEADTQKTILEGQKVTTDALKVIAEALKIKVELGLPLDADDAQTAEGQQALVDETLEETLQLSELAGSPQLQPEQFTPEQMAAVRGGQAQPQIQPGSLEEQALFEGRETPIDVRPPTAAEVSE